MRCQNWSVDCILYGVFTIYSEGTFSGFHARKKINKSSNVMKLFYSWSIVLQSIMSLTKPILQDNLFTVFVSPCWSLVPADWCQSPFRDHDVDWDPRQGSETSSPITMSSLIWSLMTRTPFTGAVRLLSSISLEFQCSGWEVPEALGRCEAKDKK